MFYVQLGPVMEGFNDQLASFISLARALFGDFDIDEILNNSRGYTNAVLFLTYLFVSVFILPPSISALEQRLAARPGSTPEIVARRMEDAKREIMHWRRYDYVIVNYDLDESEELLRSILFAERLKRRRQIGLAAIVKDMIGEG